MTDSINLEFDIELARDFADSVDESYELLETHIAASISSPDDLNPVDEIFRELHSIKSNAKMCHLDDIANLTHQIENVVSDIREEHIVMSLNVGELILMGLDRIREATNQLYSVGKIESDELLKYLQYFQILGSKSTQEVDVYAENIIAQIAGHTLDDKKTSQPIPPTKLNENNKAESHLRIDLVFFSGLITRLEANIEFWDDRSLSMWKIANHMNYLSDYQVDNIQLEAAIYMHDIAYAFLPLKTLHRTGKFTAEEQGEMQEHPILAEELLNRMPNWEQAAIMCVQHHERPDGQGYPANLQDPEISDGAKIIAIVDAFESMTHARPDREFKRSFLRAVKEINSCAGTQFSQIWIDYFNQVVHEHFVKPR